MMVNDTVKSPFADGMARNFHAKTLPEERTSVERTLGEGAIKFKLANGGMRKLMVALDRERVEAEKG